MISRLNIVAALVAVLATIAALLAVSPAQAAASGLQVLSKTIAVYGPGAGESASHPRGSTMVQVTCRGSKDCTGWASYRAIQLKPGDSGVKIDGTAGTKYRVGHGKTAYIRVNLNPDQALWNLSNFGPNEGRKAKLRLYVSKKSDVTTAVTLTKRVKGVALKGKVSGAFDTSRIKDVKVTRWSVNGLISHRDATKSINADGTFNFGLNYQLGLNNAATGNYRLSISAIVDGEYQSWFWRGDNWGYHPGRFYGGANEIREASVVHLNRNGDFQANFKLGEIKGTVDQGSSSSAPGKATIRVAAAPFSMPSNQAGVRDLDIAYCANDFGSATADSQGHYSVVFLPRSDSGTDKRYLVEANAAGGNAMTVWNNGYGSCLHARAYTNSTANLIPIAADSNAAIQNFTLRPATGVVQGEVAYSGFTSVSSDRYLTLREFIPKQTVLDSPVVKSTSASSSGKHAYTFTGVRPGKYWLEVGRRTSCSGWYKSLYANNNSYLEGSDRGAEQWKTVAGKYPEHQKSYDMGYVAKTPPKGYAGWMYRPYCRSVGAGAYKAIWVGVGGHVTTAMTVKKGATISGHVSRGKHANKEFMVSVYSTLGTLVMRSAITNSNGNFTIEGLQSGNYRIATNTDSWRGNARTFKGTKTKRVKAGGNYSVGTLKVP